MVVERFSVVHISYLLSTWYIYVDIDGHDEEPITIHSLGDIKSALEEAGYVLPKELMAGG